MLVRLFLSFLVMFLLFGTANAASCVTMAYGQEWNNAQIKLNEPAYFSLRVYNTSAEGEICKTGHYEIGLELMDSDKELAEAFEWELDSQAFSLDNGENQRVLLTLVPKQLGEYKIQVVVKRMSEGEGGNQLIYTTSAQVNASVALEGNESYNQIPFWKIRKDCPNGTVVTQGEECSKAISDTSEKSPDAGPALDSREEENNAVGLTLLGGNEAGFLAGGAVVIILILSAVAYKRRRQPT